MVSQIGKVSNDGSVQGEIVVWYVKPVGIAVHRGLNASEWVVEDRSLFVLP